MSNISEQILGDLELFIEDLRNTNTASLKSNIILSYPKVKKLLWWVYNPYKRFGVSPKTIQKYLSENIVFGERTHGYTIYDLLRDLNNRKLTGNAALKGCAEFITAYEEYKDLLYCIFDRTFKQGVSVATINAVYPKLIPVFSCAKAKDYFDYEKKINFETQYWYWSRKLDGVRVEGYIDGKGHLHPYSREGNEFTTLQVLKDAIQASGVKNIWLSGEFCLVDENGNEDFLAAVGEVKRKDHTIQNPKWYIYDCCTNEEHNSGLGDPNVGFKKRVEMYGSICKKINSPNIEALPQERVRSKEHLDELMAMAAEKGWEGIVLHEDVRYYGNKNNHILKVKKFKDAEYVVKDIEVGPFTYYTDVVRGGTVYKKRVTADMVTRLVIEHKGYIVGVGSGISISQRMDWKNHPNKIIGKTITVKYFGESKNKNGGISLRFPTLKVVYDGERDI